MLVQPYLLAFKSVLPEYERVPSKDEPFDPSFCANAHVHNNAYPASCDVISGLPQTEKVSSLYTRQRTGKVQYFASLPQTDQTKIALMEKEMYCMFVLCRPCSHPSASQSASTGSCFLDMAAVLLARRYLIFPLKGLKLEKLLSCE